MTQRANWLIFGALFVVLFPGPFPEAFCGEAPYWEKEIPHGRLVVTRTELTDKAYAEKLEQLIRSGQKFIQPDCYFTYELSLISTSRSDGKRLWQRDFAEYDKSPAGYIEPSDLHTRFLDVCVEELTGTSCLLLKQRNVTKVEIAKAAPEGIMILSKCDTNILKLDAPGVWITDSGKVSCMGSNDFRVALKAAGGKTATFVRQNGKWALESLPK